MTIRVQFGDNDADTSVPAAPAQSGVPATNYTKTARWSPSGGYEGPADGPYAGANGKEYVVDMSTPRKGGWLIPQHEIDADTIITVNGMECTVAGAAGLGLIKLDGAGRPVLPGAATPETAAAAPKPTERETSAAPAPEPLADQALEADLTAAIQANVGEVSFLADHAIRNGGELNGAALERLASAAGLEVVDVAERAEAVRAGFEAQAVAAFAKVVGSASASEAMEWAMSDPAMASKLQETALEHFTLGTTRGYAAVAKEYVASLGEIDPQGLIDAEAPAGVTLGWDDSGTGVVVSFADGRKTTWRTAVMAGWISTT